MSQETIETCQAVNNTLQVANVRAHFQTHYANAQEEIYGILELVADILRKGDACFPRNAHNTELHNIVAASAMFTSDILAEVEKRFAAGGGRYKVQAVKNVLSTYGKGIIQKIKGTNNPKASGDCYYDSPRPCAKPRCKRYLIDSK